MKFKTLFLFVAITLLTSCSIKPQKVAIAIAQAPVAESLLIEFIKDDQQLLASVELKLKDMRLFYDSLKNADDIGQAAEFVKQNWWRITSMHADWYTIKTLVENYAKENQKRPPDGLLIFVANVEVGLVDVYEGRRAKNWERAALEALKLLSTIVAVKNGVIID